MAYKFDDRDLSTLQRLADAEVARARKADDVTDDDMAHLYALKGKVASVIAARAAGEDEDDGKPAKPGNGKGSSAKGSGKPADHKMPSLTPPVKP